MHSLLLFRNHCGKWLSNQSCTQTQYLPALLAKVHRRCKQYIQLPVTLWIHCRLERDKNFLQLRWWKCLGVNKGRRRKARLVLEKGQLPLPIAYCRKIVAELQPWQTGWQRDSFHLRNTTSTHGLKNVLPILHACVYMCVYVCVCSCVWGVWVRSMVITWSTYYPESVHASFQISPLGPLSWPPPPHAACQASAGTSDSVQSGLLCNCSVTLQFNVYRVCCKPGGLTAALHFEERGNFGTLLQRHSPAAAWRWSSGGLPFAAAEGWGVCPQWSCRPESILLFHMKVYMMYFRNL